MPLDATVGGANSNSYVTRAEADEYFALRSHSAGWSDLNPDQQDAFLVTASRQLDWYFTWKGYKATDTQAMDWPRKEVLDPNTGVYFSDTIVPTPVKQASFELALSSLESDRMADNDLAGLSEVRAASLMIKTDDKDFNSDLPKAIPDKIKKILDGLVTSSGIGVVRLHRA